MQQKAIKHSDKTWDFNQSEHVQGPMINGNNIQYKTQRFCKLLSTIQAMGKMFLYIKCQTIKYGKGFITPHMSFFSIPASTFYSNLFKNC